MKIGTMKPTATVVAQFSANVEVTVIQHEGQVYLPVFSLDSFQEKEPLKKEPTTEEPKIAEPKESVKESVKAAAKSYTEEELTEMSVKELKKILDDMGIDPDEEEGKNTNKKLRNMILDAQDEPEEPTEEPEEKDAEEEDVEEKDEEVGDAEEVAVDTVLEILEDFDGGKLSKKKALKKLTDLSTEKSNLEKVQELLDEFEDDAELDINDVGKDIASALLGESKERKAGKKEALVEVEDLEVGDKVSIYWADENKDWFDGTVESIKKGKVMVAYDDGTKEVIDPEIHTKIRKL